MNKLTFKQKIKIKSIEKIKKCSDYNCERHWYKNPNSDVVLNDDMIKFCGRIFTVESIVCFGYKICGCVWTFASWMIDNVEFELE